MKASLAEHGAAAAVSLLPASVGPNAAGSSEGVKRLEARVIYRTPLGRRCRVARLDKSGTAHLLYVDGSSTEVPEGFSLTEPNYRILREDARQFVQSRAPR